MVIVILWFCSYQRLSVCLMDPLKWPAIIKHKCKSNFLTRQRSHKDSSKDQWNSRIKLTVRKPQWKNVTSQTLVKYSSHPFLFPFHSVFNSNKYISGWKTIKPVPRGSVWSIPISMLFVLGKNQLKMYSCYRFIIHVLIFPTSSMDPQADLQRCDWSERVKSIWARSLARTHTQTHVGVSSCNIWDSSNALLKKVSRQPHQ